MPAVELSDRELRFLADIAREAKARKLAAKLTANTFEARGLREPSPALVHVARADK